MSVYWDLSQAELGEWRKSYNLTFIGGHSVSSRHTANLQKHPKKETWHRSGLRSPSVCSHKQQPWLRAHRACLVGSFGPDFIYSEELKTLTYSLDVFTPWNWQVRPYFDFRISRYRNSQSSISSERHWKPFVQMASLTFFLNLHWEGASRPFIAKPPSLSLCQLGWKYHRHRPMQLPIWDLLIISMMIFAGADWLSLRRLYASFKFSRAVRERCASFWSGFWPSLA